MNGLRLYVWENVLTDYTDGIVFALATNVDEARLLVMKKYDLGDYELAKSGRFSPDAERDGETGYISHPQIWEDMRTEPDVYDSPEGFYIWGGG